MMLLAAGPAGPNSMWTVGMAVVIFAAVCVIVLAGWEPLRRLLARQEESYDRVLRRSLLLDVNPRVVSLLGLGAIFLLALIAYALINNFMSAVIGGVIGGILPALIVRYLKRRRLYKLEDQLVDGIQTLCSGVRAGLNLVQAMDLLARNAVRPISQEFGHLIREYEHGVSVEQAMQNAGARIGSANYRLLFSALLTHRERGGDLGETLERIADSIREIHRLEKRIETLTAPGRTAARWMGAMPAVILGILYLIDPDDVSSLFVPDPSSPFPNAGRAILVLIIVLNILGFLWIRKIVSIDV